MKIFAFNLILLFQISFAFSQEYTVDPIKVKEDLDLIITSLSEHYVYLPEKGVDLDCIRDHYQQQIEYLETDDDVILFFEYLLDEFYDSHLILNINTNESFRLHAPVYAKEKEGSFMISNVWQTEITNLDEEIIEAEILEINGVDFNTAIDNFPTHCQDKDSKVVREWIANKILAGKYNIPRNLTLQLKNQSIIDFNLDEINFKKHDELLTYHQEDNIGIIRINNSLGDNRLISAFDEALDALMDTKGLIIDLRNTVDGGNTYVARGIMGRFVQESQPYQIHTFLEKYDDNPEIERRWAEYVVPRKQSYDGSVVVLVGRWTGSMGEGLAIGFEGIGRGEIVGSEMERLAGGMSGFSFQNRNFGYRIATEKIFHVDGTPREKYIPTNYVIQNTLKRDEVLMKGMEIILDK